MDIYGYISINMDIYINISIFNYGRKDQLISMSSRISVWTFQVIVQLKQIHGYVKLNFLPM